jgi:hypothetical protein
LLKSSWIDASCTLAEAFGAQPNMTAATAMAAIRRASPDIPLRAIAGMT